MQTDSQKNPTGMPPASPSPLSDKARIMLVLALLLVAANLRPVIISVGPVLDSLQASLGLSGSASGFLITLPILCFGAFAPFVPRLLSRYSAERTILVSLVVLAAGIVLRSVLGAGGLFTGTLLIGASISVIMVLLPSIIKRQFPTQGGMMMGLYSTALCIGAALAAGITVPIQNLPGSNWQLALAFWVLPVLAAIAVWRPFAPARPTGAAHARSAIPRLRRNKLAWQISFFMGLQSAVAYCTFGWLAFIIIDRGLPQVTAGLVLSICLIMQIVTSLLGPWAATRGRDQRSAIAIMLALSLGGILGLIYAPLSQVWLWSIVHGLGMGGVFSIALALLVLRAPNPQVAAALSGMAQGVGYTIAAIGPFAIGLLHELTGNWHGVALLYTLMILGGFYTGMNAGKAVYVRPDA